MNYFDYLAAYACDKINFIEPDISTFILEVNTKSEPLQDNSDFEPIAKNPIENTHPNPLQQNITAGDDSEKHKPDLTENKTNLSELKINSVKTSEHPAQSIDNLRSDFYSEKIIEHLRHTEIIEHNNTILGMEEKKQTQTDNLNPLTAAPGNLFNKISSQTNSPLPAPKENDADLPSINITIGKIEVKAAQQLRKNEHTQKDQKPQLSLNDYLKSFNKGKQ